MTLLDHVPTPPETSDAPDGFAWLAQQALFTLTPFFMDGAAGDATNARAAAEALLASYPIETPQDLQLATECIVCAYAAMDNLRQAKTDPEMPESRRLRLRSAAASLNRASHRARRSLDVRYKPRAPAAEPRDAPPEPSGGEATRAATELLQEFIAQTAQHREHPPVARTPAAPSKFLTREQRRAAKLAARREIRRTQDLAYAASHAPA